jgi:thiamine transport system permease protein
LAVGLAIPVARALARRQAFAGRTLLLRLFGLPLVVPGIVAVLGIVAIAGRNGAVNQALGAFGLPEMPSIYGLAGILIAHVFFNLPLAARLLLQAWDTVPGETWRLAGQLGMGSGAIFRLIEWPLLRAALPGIAGLVFMLCFASFTVVLTLGGGPAATTIEVAIYQALRFDFEPGRAVVLALVQLVLCGGLIAAGHRLIRPMAQASSLGRSAGRPDVSGALGRLGDGLAILAATLLVAAPLGAVALAGAAGPLASVLTEPALWRACALSLAIGLTAALLALSLGCALLGAARYFRLRLGRPGTGAAIEGSGAAVLVVPPFVLGAGWFVLLHGRIDVLAIGPIVVVAVNALMALPYVMRGLGPAIARADERHDRLCRSLGIGGWRRFRLIDWPGLRRPLALVFALAMALSVGDLGAIALFGTQDTATLPLLLYQRMGSYRIDEAAAIALVLGALSLGLFAAIERGFGGHERG